MNTDQNKDPFSSMKALIEASEKRSRLGELLVLKAANEPMKLSKLFAAETICEQVGALGWGAKSDEELRPLLSQHIQLTAISAAYATAVERHMSSIFDSVICPSQNSSTSACLSAVHLEGSPEWLEQLAQLNLLFQMACSGNEQAS